MATTVGMRIVGREQELAAVDAFLADEHGPQALVLAGQPGIGKTTIWEAGAQRGGARGLRVLGARATESEVQLSFVALSDLLEDVDTASLAAVPPPQLRALETALLRAEPGETPPDSFAVSAGFASALRALSAERPLLVAIDDVPWLDPPSAEALVFAARRLEKYPIRFLLARRPGKQTELERAFGALRLRRVELPPLSLGATRALLADRLGLTLPRRVLRRVFDLSGGNPLFALEVGRLLVERGTPEIGADLPVPELVDDLFGERIAALDRPVRRALLAVSLSGGLARLQLATLVDPLALEDAVASGLLVVDGPRVRVSHPLLAAASSKQSTAEERRELHLNLARAAGDAPLRAQHLALAAETPDAELATSVAEAAAEAISRGAAHDAIELAEQAFRLTPAGASESTERLLDLARYLVIAGEIPRAKGLVEEHVSGVPPGPGRARAYLVLVECAETSTEYRTLLERALDECGDDPALRAVALSRKATALAAMEFRDLDEAERLANEAIEIAPAAGREELRSALCALAWVWVMRGRPIDDLAAQFETHPQGASLYERALERVELTRLTVRGELREARVLSGKLRRLAEERGEARSGMMMHHGLIEAELRSGNAAAAEALMAPAGEWSAFEDPDEIRGPQMAMLEAIRGRVEEAERWAAETIERATRTGMVREVMEGRRARGIVALLRRDPRRAAEELRPIWAHACREGIDEPGVWWIAPDLVEALTETGELDEARAVTDRLARLAEEQEHPWGLPGAKRCRALCSFASGRYDDEASALLSEAAEAYGELGLGFDQARSLLLLGRFARRHRKRGRARRSLEQAAAILDSLGADGWAEEARAELERVAGRRAAAEGALTPTEERVARLAADGLSNKQIAAQLYVSVSTVEKHLSHAYEKLGVRSRGQLASRVQASSTRIGSR
jgi:DNA-binding CsgD family transcriptional regulator